MPKTYNIPERASAAIFGFNNVAKFAEQNYGLPQCKVDTTLKIELFGNKKITNK
jgi:hypothetical protein